MAGFIGRRTNLARRSRISRRRSRSVWGNVAGRWPAASSEAPASPRGGALAWFCVIGLSYSMTRARASAPLSHAAFTPFNAWPADLDFEGGTLAAAGRVDIAGIGHDSRLLRERGGRQMGTGAPSQDLLEQARRREHCGLLAARMRQLRRVVDADQMVDAAEEVGGRDGAVLHLFAAGIACADDLPALEAAAGDEGAEDRSPMVASTVPRRFPGDFGGAAELAVAPDDGACRAGRDRRGRRGARRRPLSSSGRRRRMVGKFCLWVSQPPR